MTSYQIIRPAAPMRDKPSHQSGLETEALFGEEVSILEEKGDWVRARLDTDGYEAWLEKCALGQLPKPTHRINVVRALITSGKDIKTPNLGYLPFGALVAVMAETDGVAEIALGNKDGDGGKGYIPASHAAPLDAPPDAPLDEQFADWVQCAEQFLGVPYRWGGRDSIGMDCSALVQLALMAGGMTAPRNSGDQFRALGETLPEGTAFKTRGFNFLARACRHHAGFKTPTPCKCVARHGGKRTPYRCAHTHPKNRRRYHTHGKNGRCLMTRANYTMYKMPG